MESKNPQAKWPTHTVVNAFLSLAGMPLWHGVMAEGGRLEVHFTQHPTGNSRKE